jgi:hypothetical protein
VLNSISMPVPFCNSRFHSILSSCAQKMSTWLPDSSDAVYTASRIIPFSLNLFISDKHARDYHYNHTTYSYPALITFCALFGCLFLSSKSDRPAVTTSLTPACAQPLYDLKTTQNKTSLRRNAHASQNLISGLINRILIAG